MTITSKKNKINFLRSNLIMVLGAIIILPTFTYIVVQQNSSQASYFRRNVLSSPNLVNHADDKQGNPYYTYIAGITPANSNTPYVGYFQLWINQMKNGHVTEGSVNITQGVANGTTLTANIHDVDSVGSQLQVWATNPTNLNEVFCRINLVNVRCDVGPNPFQDSGRTSFFDMKLDPATAFIKQPVVPLSPIRIHISNDNPAKGLGGSVHASYHVYVSGTDKGPYTYAFFCEAPINTPDLRFPTRDEILSQGDTKTSNSYSCDYSTIGNHTAAIYVVHGKNQDKNEATIRVQ